MNDLSTLTSAIKHIKRPAQLVTFFLVIVAIYWIKEYGEKFPDKTLIVILVCALLVIAVILLEVINMQGRKNSIYPTIVLFGGLISAFIYLITLIAPQLSPKNGSFEFAIEVVDMKDKRFKDMDDIEIQTKEGGNWLDLDKDEKHSSFSYRLNSSSENHKYKFRLVSTSGKYTFSNGKATLDFISSTSDTVIQLKSIPEPPKVKKSRNTFSITPSSGYIIEKIKARHPLLHATTDDPYYKIRVYHGGDCLRFDDYSNTWYLTGCRVYVSVNGSSKVIGTIRASAPMKDRRDIEIYAEQCVRSIIRNYRNWGEIIND